MVTLPTRTYDNLKVSLRNIENAWITCNLQARLTLHRLLEMLLANAILFAMTICNTWLYLFWQMDSFMISILLLIWLIKILIFQWVLSLLGLETMISRKCNSLMVISSHYLTARAKKWEILFNLWTLRYAEIVMLT